MRPKGFLSISKITLADGTEISTQQAIQYGWISPVPGRHAGWDLARHEVPLGTNLWVDQGRQLAAFCMGFRSPIADYTIAKFGVGTGSRAPNVADVALESPIVLASTASVVAPINGIDFLSPFVMRVSYTVAAGDANGNLITERGLFSGNNTLLARHVTSAGINKTSDFSPTLTWRLRF